MDDVMGKRLAYSVNSLDMETLADQVFYMLFREWFEVNCDKKMSNGPREFLESIEQLRKVSARLSDRSSVHVLQIRSIPVRDFGFLLRHYFVRIDELVEIHPGNEEKICVRGWMRTVDIGSDCLHVRYLLCANCADRAVDFLWSYSRKFSFAFRNCDQNCNDSRQSVGIACTIFLVLVGMVCLFVQHAVLPFCLITLGLLFGFTMLSFSQSIVAARLMQFLGGSPAVVERNVLSSRCPHVVSSD